MTADRPETTRAGVCRCGHGSERMISYAQGAEDVVLHRALCREGVGRYVDVGAFSPDVCSVTRHFYDVGWSGIDVEPLPEEAAELRLARPRDIVIEAALGRAAGETTIYIVGDERGLSSTEVELGEAYARAGHPVREQVVVLRTLAEVLGEYCTGEISFLKVDVEGAEAEVLEGNDWARWRPRVVLVEATKPWSHEQAHEGWEPTLLAAGYLSRRSTESTDTTRAPRNQISCPCLCRRLCSTTSYRRARIASRNMRVIWRNMRVIWRNMCVVSRMIFVISKLG